MLTFARRERDAQPKSPGSAKPPARCSISSRQASLLANYPRILHPSWVKQHGQMPTTADLCLSFPTQEHLGYTHKAPLMDKEEKVEDHPCDVWMYDLHQDASKYPHNNGQLQQQLKDELCVLAEKVSTVDLDDDHGVRTITQAGHGPPGGESSHANKNSGGSGPQYKEESHHGDHNDMEQGKPRGPGDNGDQRKDGEDNNNSNTNNSGKPPKRKAEVHQRWEQPLSCPFRKRNRQRFNYRLHKSCTNPFKDVQAVKAHVRNWHKLSVEQSSHQCPRCWETFSSKKGLTQHASHPVDQICEPREQPVNNNEPEDGITDKTSNSLVARKGKDKVSSWDDMWNLLFPDDINVPSPDHEPSGIAEVFEYSQVFDELLAHESVVTGLPENMRSVLKGIMDEKLGCLEQRVLLESAASASGRGRSGTATSGNVPERSQSQGPGNIGSFEPPSLQISYATPQRHRQTARHAKRQSISSPKAIAPKVNTSFRNQSSSFYHPGSGSLSAPMTPSPHSGSSMSSFQSIHSLPSLWGDHGVSPTVGDPSALQPPAMPSYSSQPTGFVTNQLQGGQPVMYPGDNPHFPSYYAAPHAAGAGSGGVMAAEAFPNQLGGYHSTLGSWEDLTSSHSLPGPMQPPDQGTE